MSGVKALVLSSGGVDSTTCLALAIKEVGKDNVTTVSVSYGQKHSVELDKAKEIAKHYQVAHEIINLENTGIMDKSNCSLLASSGVDIESGEYANQIAKQESGIVNTYVPFRNGLILSSAAALALSLYPDNEIDIYLGAHADDNAGAAYADCTPEFTKTIGQAINLGTYGKVNIKTPLINLNKAEVIREGLKLNTPYHLTWSCYEGGGRPCGKCATCIDREMAFKLNGIEDPAL